MRLGKAAVLAGLSVLLASVPAFAGTVNSGDTAWVITATALVIMMTPAGLALFYGGMVRSKNILNTIALSYVSFAVASLLWIAIAYTIAFGPDIGGFVGGLSHIFLSGFSPNTVSSYANIPAYAFVGFQMAFAGIAIALVSGSLVERLKLSSWIFISALWIIFVYAPIAHWVWAHGGWLNKMGALDFAGGAVIHINAGISGLVLALLLGKRKGYGKEAFFPISIVLTALGAALLWFGWFGFNGGSALAANGSAATAILTTNLAASAAMLMWMLIEYIRDGKPTVLGAASGVVAGLVGITPAAGFVGFAGAMIIGAIAAIVGYFGVSILKPLFGYDDSLDVFGVHGLCGMWGALATGIFANPSICGKAGLVYGNAAQMIPQIVSIIAVVVYAGIVTFIIGIITKAIFGLKVDENVEVEGLDKAIHGESGFRL